MKRSPKQPVLTDPFKKVKNTFDLAYDELQYTAVARIQQTRSSHSIEVHSLSHRSKPIHSFFGYMTRVYKRSPARPRIKTPKTNQPLTTTMDQKLQQGGLHCTVFSPSGNEYKGEWLDNKKHGKGTQVWRKSGAIYDGEWKYGKCDGYGTYSMLLPDTKEYTKKYCGEWKNGKKHGFGIYFYSSSRVYEGEWIENHRSGWGRMYYENGDIYEGEWMKDKSHGKGIIRYMNGNWYEGSWREGKKNGNGKLYYSDKGQLYEGFWVNGDAKCGTLCDLEQAEEATPKKYLIPQLQLADMESVLKEGSTAHFHTSPHSEDKKN